MAGKALATMKEKVRAFTRRTVGRSIERVCGALRVYLQGWKQTSDWQTPEESSKTWTNGFGTDFERFTSSNGVEARPSFANYPHGE